MTFLRLLTAAAGLLLGVGPALAQSTYTWQTTTGSWNVAGNWLNQNSAAGVPVSANTTTLVFNASGLDSYTATNNIGTGTFTLNRLVVNNTGSGTVTINGTATGNTLTFAGTDPTLDITGTTLFNGLFANATALRKVGTGTFIHDSDNAAFTGTLTIDAGTFINRATTNATANFNPVSIVVNNGGTYQFGAATVGDPNLPNSTYITVNAGGTVNWQEGETFGGFHLNGGTINFQQGGVTADGTTAQAWTSGTFAGGTFGANGSSVINKTTAGTVAVGGGVSIGGGGALNILDGTISHVAAGNLGTRNVTLGSATTAGAFEYQGATAARAGTFGLNAGGGIVRVTNAATTFTLSGVLSGTGGLTKDGAGTLALSAVNTYSGGTTVAGGTLQLGTGGATGSVAGNVAVQSGASLAINRSDNATFANNTSGAGNLVKLGGNTLTLTGTLGHTGTTAVSGGTLRVNAQSLGGGLSLADGTGLVSISPTTAGTLTASGLNLGAGGTSLRFEMNASGNPTVPLLNVTAADGLVLNGGTHTVSLSNRQPFAVGTFTVIDYSGGPISSGFTLAPLPARTLGGLVYDTANTQINLAITGVDSVVWTGAVNGTWDAGTDIGVGGTLNWKLASNSSPTNFVAGDVARFDDSSAVTAVNLATALAPTAVTVDTANTYTFDGGGSLTGTGSLTKLGSGTLVLLTNNDYSGDTTVTAGTLRVGNGGTVGSLGTGGVVNNGGLVFDRSDDLSFGGDLSGTGTLTKAGSNTLTLTLTGRYTSSGGTTIAGGGLVLNASADYTYAGGFTGAGSLTKLGTGTVTLTGASDHTGGTTITGGVLRVGNGGTTGSLAGNVVNSGGLAFDRSDDLSFGGDLSGTGTLTKAGAGRLTLTGAISTTGATTVSAGTLRIGTGGSVSGIGGNLAVASGATFELATSSDLVYTSVVSGAGTVAKSGTGILILDAANTGFTGTLRIDAGSVILRDNGGTGGDINATNIVVNSGGLFQFGAGGITGENPDLPDTTYVTVNAGGEFIVRVGEQFGGINLLGGTLTLNGGSAGGLVGTVAMDWRSGTVNGITANGTTGANTITKTTAGVVSVTGLATVGNVLNIQDGTVSFATAANLGTAAINLGGTATTGTFEYLGATASRGGNTALGSGGGTIRVGTAGTTLTLSGVLSGTGGLTKSGAGTLALSGANTYTGATAVNAGTLLVTGNSASATGAITVASGGTQGGTGTVGGATTVQSGGSVRGGSGATTGTLTTGNVTVNGGGSILANLAAPGTSSQLAVGTNTLNLLSGSKLSLTAVSGFSGAAGTYTLATVTDGSTLQLDGAGQADGFSFGKYVEGTGATGPVVIDTAALNFTLTVGDTFELNRVGNNLVLSFTPVPEPATVLAVGAAGLGLFGWVRRKRAK